jgi:hypothetical protein
MLDCIGLLGPNKSLWLYCLADESETYSYDDFPTGTYRWSLRGLRWLDEGEILHVQKSQVLNTRGLRRLKYDEAPQMYALAWLVESNPGYVDLKVA